MKLLSTTEVQGSVVNNNNSEADMKVIESELVSRIERNGFDDGYVLRPSEVAEAIITGFS